MIENFTGVVLSPESADFAPTLAAWGLPADAALIARPSSPADVAAAVAHARTTGLPLAVRSGGHGSFYSYGGALVVDLSGFADVEVLDGGRVRIGSGAVWGDVASALQPHGLALSSGDTATVGVGGLTLGGGVGWMVRQYGLALDSLLEAEVVLASGETVTASAESHPDLFWALRGGGGNVGIVTRFTFQAHPLPGVVAGTITVDPARLGEVLRGYRDVMRAAPEELNATYLGLPAFGPDADPTAAIVVVYAGDDVELANAAIAPLLEIPGVTGHDVAAKGYRDVLEEPEGPEGEIIMVDENGFADDLTDELIDGVVAAYRSFGAAILMLRYLRGAYNRVPEQATAFAHRSAEALIITAAFLPPDSPADAEPALRATWAALEGISGTYGNFTPRRGDAITQVMYPAATLERLRAVKAQYDPHNLFTHNHNIAP